MDNNWKQRVIQEKEDLYKRRDKLNDFILTQTYMDLDPRNQSLLNKQLLTMNSYIHILTERIMLF